MGYNGIPIGIPIINNTILFPITNIHVKHYLHVDIFVT